MHLQPHSVFQFIVALDHNVRPWGQSLAVNFGFVFVAHAHFHGMADCLAIADGKDPKVIGPEKQNGGRNQQHIGDLANELRPHITALTVRLRPEAAELFGLTPGHVRRTATTLVQGAKVGEVYQQQRAYAVTVWGTETVRGDVNPLGDLLIDLPRGGQVPLRDVAEIAIEPAPNEIKREGASRRLGVTCNAEARDLGSVVREIEQGVRGLTFAQGYHPEFLGEYAARQESQRQLLLLAGLAVPWNSQPTCSGWQGHMVLQSTVLLAQTSYLLRG